MEYNFNEIEARWRKRWEADKTFAAQNHSDKPKYYVLDMFPYPSGAGLHVGHPLGYIASDIMARFKRHKGFNVLHPMGFDAFGLPAEQYAIQTGRHPADTTAENIARYIEQLKKIGFAYDWDRQVNTSDPSYYRWTQWIFVKLFNHWYDKDIQKARPISELISIFERQGNAGYDGMTISGNVEQNLKSFSAEEWKAFTPKEKSEVLMCYRLAYQDFAWVNWCEALGTVLANDEVKDGVSERGGHPVERKQLAQWFLRITMYAERLLNDLDMLDWSDSMKEMQRHWIGKSEGAKMRFVLKDKGRVIEVFTTRPDTIFGVSFLVLAPESEMLAELTTEEQKTEVDAYVQQAKNRSERERQMDVKTVSGVFTGSYAVHPFSGEPIPIWIGDYVLAGYGTGAVMGVPAHDERDFRFAKHFNLPVVPVVKPTDAELPEVLEDAFSAKEGVCINSDFLNGLTVKAAIDRAIEEAEKRGIGKREINYRLRDANFSRQRYWGEPFPVIHKPDGNVETLKEEELPLILPEMDDFKPTGRPESPLAKLTEWVNLPDGSRRETDTMPGFAGSSWYFLRYMDPGNHLEFASKEALNYWQDVDLYIGGTEHAVGHLLYSRFWHKFLYDLGYVPTVEPFKKLVNQGMIQGVSAKLKIAIHPTNDHPPVIISCDDSDREFELDGIHFKLEGGFLNPYVDINFLTYNDSEKVYILTEDSYKKNLENEYKKAFHDIRIKWIEGDKGKYISLSAETEKMSKSKFNVVNPDDLCAKYGADTLRMYEMFLGPVEQSKPWNTNGIEGVHRFLKRFWNLFHAGDTFTLNEEAADKKELKILHTAIKKISTDIENFSFNTCVSHFMICCNELTELKCNKRSVLEPLLVLLSPFAPHIAEELWHKAGHADSVSVQPWPVFDEAFLVEDSFSYPVSFNGKMRFQMELPSTLDPKSVEAAVMADERTARWLEGKSPKKVIVVPKKIVNIVI
jgi:leucyl-tRNA synthetase